MEASAIPAPSGLTRTRVSLGAPLLRLRSDEQLVALFRDGNNDAFRVIHDRYRQRLFAYTRQMLPGSRQDAEDALQDVFVRAYNGLRANHRELALRAWLYRVAHNRCIDELRRPAPPAPEVLEIVRSRLVDPMEEAEQRESLRRLVADIRRLPEQQRSALLMRELGGMSYVEVAAALGVSVPAVKSLLVRARVGLAQALEARDAPCAEIREELIVAHDRGVRATAIARRHIRDCAGCREFRAELRSTSKQFAALLPLGPLAMLAKVLGLGFGGGAGAGGTAASGTAAGGTAAGGTAAGTTALGGTVASAGVVASGASHVATLLAAAVVTAGGAVEIQHTIAGPPHHAHHRAIVAYRTAAVASPVSVPTVTAAQVAYVAPPVQPPAAPGPARAAAPSASQAAATASASATSHGSMPASAATTPNHDAFLPPQPMPDLTQPYGSPTPGGSGSGSGGSTSGTSGTGSVTGATGDAGSGTGSGSGGSTSGGSGGSTGTGGSGGSTGTTGSGGSTGTSGSGGSTGTGGSTGGSGSSSGGTGGTGTTTGTGAGTSGTSGSGLTGGTSSGTSGSGGTSGTS